MALPPMTPEQRADALAKAKLANGERMKLKDGLKAGTMTLADAFKEAGTSDAIARMKVSVLLQALPGVGPVRAAKIMADNGIAESRRLRGVGANQRKALVEEFAPADA